MDSYDEQMMERHKRWESIPERIRTAARTDDLVAAYMNLTLSTGMWDADAATQLICKMAERDAQRVKALIDIHTNGLPPMVIHMDEATAQRIVAGGAGVERKQK